MSKQAYYQGKLILSREAVDEVLAADRVTEAQKKKLLFTKEVLKFAADNGLEFGGSYQHYIHTEQPVVSFLVYAAHKDKLELKKWWFPIVGSVPYIGYFHKEDRDEEAKKLENDDLDVYKTGASAFSLLGWISDPIYTSMLNYTDMELAHLLFHELTHKTFWSPDKVTFNENLAEFVAIHLTQLYVEKLGNKAEYQDYLDKRGDNVLYRNWLSALRADLKNLYQTNKDPRDILLKKKAELFQLYLSSQKLPKFKTDEFAFVPKRQWNNASVLAASIYMPDIEIFEKAWECLQRPKMGAFLMKLKDAIKITGNGPSALDSFCPQPVK